MKTSLDSLGTENKDLKTSVDQLSKKLSQVEGIYNKIKSYLKKRRDEKIEERERQKQTKYQRNVGDNKFFGISEGKKMQK